MGALTTRAGCGVEYTSITSGEFNGTFLVQYPYALTRNLKPILIVGLWGLSVSGVGLRSLGPKGFGRF